MSSYKPSHLIQRLDGHGAALGWDLYVRTPVGYVTHELFRIEVVDERPEVEDDPTLCIYRSTSGWTEDLSEEPVLQVKLKELTVSDVSEED